MYNFFQIDYDDDEVPVPVFQLNLKFPEQNVNGLFAYLTQFKYKDGGSTMIMDAIIIHKPWPDVTDLVSRGLTISATLMEGGSQIEIVEPSLPYFMTEEVHKLYEGLFDEDQPLMTASIQDSHKYTVLAIKGRETRKKKTYILNLPNGLKGAPGYMNQGASSGNGVKLTPSLYSGSETLTPEETGADADMTFTHHMTSFIIPLETNERRVVELKEDEYQPIQKMFQRFRTMTVNGSDPGTDGGDQTMG